MYKGKLLNLGGAFTIAACLQATAASADACDKRIQSGTASWYGEEMAVARHGGRNVYNKTASGDTFDPNQVSAAHKTLPLGTVIKVVTGDNRSIKVEINDRGPYAKGRILDLSRAAAERLRIKNKGEARVTLYRCSP